MNNKHHRDSSQGSAALKNLVEHLSVLNARGSGEPTIGSDMLSLIVNGALTGENIAKKYPAFHKKLLENPEFHQAFLDALESVEAERTGRLTPIPNPQTDLGFLTEQTDSPFIKLLDGQNWRVNWGRTLEQLQAIFSPSELAYRNDPTLSEDPWFTLLRGELGVEGVTYDVILDCTLSNEGENALAAFLHIAVTVENDVDKTTFPLNASLHWGDYQESITIPQEGRFRFPDVPLNSVFDQAELHLKAGFSLTLETTS